MDTYIKKWMNREKQLGIIHSNNLYQLPFTLKVMYIPVSGSLCNYVKES